ncbi:MAG: hypothetical protein AB8I08_26870 [Sandaracinaceae bacterium]
MPFADRALLLTLVATAWLGPLAGCGGTESRLNPEERLDELPTSAVAQLCRYTVDVLDGQDVTCVAESDALTSTDTCQATPPWEAYETVRDWEDCVNARLSDPCLVEAPCAP